MLQMGWDVSEPLLETYFLSTYLHRKNCFVARLAASLTKQLVSVLVRTWPSNWPSNLNSITKVPAWRRLMNTSKEEWKIDWLIGNQETTLPKYQKVLCSNVFEVTKLSQGYSTLPDQYTVVHSLDSADYPRNYWNYRSASIRLRDLFIMWWTNYVSNENRLGFGMRLVADPSIKYFTL